MCVSLFIYHTEVLLEYRHGILKPSKKPQNYSNSLKHKILERNVNRMLLTDRRKSTQGLCKTKRLDN